MGSYRYTVFVGFRCPGPGAGTVVYPIWQTSSYLFIVLFGLLRLGFHESAAFGSESPLAETLLASRGILRLSGGRIHKGVIYHYRRSPACGE